jgi:pSer/pThr/pTyr-binding forkhead associated (FHA) protein
MDFEIGIVCARCESYATLGTASCGSCGNALALETASPLSSKPPATTRNPFVSDVPTSSRPEPSRPEPSPATPSARAGAYADVPGRHGTNGASEAGKKSPARPDPRAEPDAEPGPRSPRSKRPSTRQVQSEPRMKPSQTPAEKGSGPPPSVRARRSTVPPVTQPKPSKSKSVEELMDQAKNFVCRSCSTPVPMGHKFCGRCGAAVPPEILNARTQFFGQLQAPGKAKLILIRGEGVEGLSYQLNAEQHVVGKAGQLVFPDDAFVSPKHANFFYRTGKLVVRDEGSVNGVYLRVRGSVELAPGDFFLAGEQVFRLDATPKLNDQAGPDGTYFYSSPKHQSLFRIVQILQGGAAGMTVCARGNSLQIGREGGDLNFPSDLYMSASHCRLEEQGGKFVLTDLNSRNGSYVRLKAERELSHGDYLFIGRKLLRVEITAS